MRRVLCAVSAIFVAILSSPLIAWGRGDDDVALPNARYEGYKIKVGVENRSATVLWIILIALIILGLISLFKNARRTHLD